MTGRIARELAADVAELAAAIWTDLRALAAEILTGQAA